MEYDYESKNLDELRMDFLSEKYDNVLFTKEMARDIVLKIHYETAINNKEEFLDSLKKLISLDNAYSKLSYEIDKVKILKYLKYIFNIILSNSFSFSSSLLIVLEFILFSFI